MHIIKIWCPDLPEFNFFMKYLKNNTHLVEKLKLIAIWWCITERPYDHFCLCTWHRNFYFSCLCFLIRVSIAVTKHHEPKQSWKERAYISALLFITDGSQGRSANRVGSWRQKLMKRPQSGVSFHGLLNPPPNRTQDQKPRDGIPTMDWDLFLWSLNEKMP